MNDVEERAELVDLVQLARQRAGEIEAEAVDVHLDDPVAQAVHDELQHARVAHVQRVAAAGEVHVVARVVRRAAGSRTLLSMPRSESVGPEVVAFGRVVVDDVEDHLDAGGVQRADHRLELAHGFERRAATREARRRARSTTSVL